MGFFKYFLLKGFLAGSLLGSPIFCTIVEKEFVIKDGEEVEVEKGKGQGVFTRYSDQACWYTCEIKGMTFWVLEIEFGNGRAKTFFRHKPTDKNPPKICSQNKPIHQGFTDKFGRNFGSANGEFSHSDGFNGWRFFYGEFPENKIHVERVEFWEKSDKTYLAYYNYHDKEIFENKKKSSVSILDIFKYETSKFFSRIF